MPASMLLPRSVLHPAALAPAPGAASKRETSYPCSTRAFAAPNPAQPPPMTATRGALGEGLEEDLRGEEEAEVEVEEVEEEVELVVGDSAAASSSLEALTVEFPGSRRLNCASDDDCDREGRRPKGFEERGPAGRRRESMVRFPISACSFIFVNDGRRVDYLFQFFFSFFVDVARVGSQSRPVAPRSRRLCRREARCHSHGIGLPVRKKGFPFSLFGSQNLVFFFFPRSASLNPTPPLRPPKTFVSLGA